MTQMWIFQDLGRDLGQDFRLKFGMKFGLGVMALMLSGVPLASADQLASANQPTTAGFSGEIEMGSAMSAARRVNFINNVRYNSNLINSTSTFDQFGSSITIGALK